MKQTAVEWLEKELNKFIPKSLDILVNTVIQQAKEMEKQQIIDAVEWGNRKGYDEHTLTCIYDEDLKYYNETFKQQTPWYDEDQTTERINVIGQNGNEGEHYNK